jgi:hypothetical protein
VGFKKQVQVAVDWALATVFPRDAASVRRPRACPLCEAKRIPSVEAEARALERD